MEMNCPLTTGCPLKSHCVVTRGEPCARHLKITVLPSVAFWSAGAVSITGGSAMNEIHSDYIEHKTKKFKFKCESAEWNECHHLVFYCPLDRKRRKIFGLHALLLLISCDCCSSSSCAELTRLSREPSHSLEFVFVWVTNYTQSNL